MFAFLLLEGMDSAAAQCIRFFIFSSSNWFPLSKDTRKKGCLVAFHHFLPGLNQALTTTQCSASPNCFPFPSAPEFKQGKGAIPFYDWPAWGQPVVTQIKLMQSGRKREAEAKPSLPYPHTLPDWFIWTTLTSRHHICPNTFYFNYLIFFF